MVQPPVPISALEEALDVEGARELLEAFMEDTATTLKVIEQSITERKSEALRAASHLLKGCYKVIGAGSAASVCSAMESDASSSSWQSAEERLPQLTRDYYDIREFVRKYLNGG